MLPYPPNAISLNQQEEKHRRRPLSCHNASTPTIPTTPAIPTPSTPEVAIGILAPALEEEELSSPALAVASPPAEELLSLAVLVIVVTLLLVLLEVDRFAEFVGITSVPVPAATPLVTFAATFGTMYVCTSEGRALNHDGVWPAANSEAIWLETAAELVRAAAMRDDGRAVSRTEMTETL